MSMTRVNAFTYLTVQLRGLLDEVGTGIAAPNQAIDLVIDDALLMIGVAASGLATAVVADSQVFGYRRVLRYAGLLFVYDQALNRVDIQIADPDVRKSRSQFVAQLEKAIAAAKSEAEPFIVATAEITAGAIAFGPAICVDEYSEVW